MEEERILRIRKQQKLQNETINIENGKQHQKQTSRGSAREGTAADYNEITQSLIILKATIDGKRRCSQANKRRKRQMKRENEANTVTIIDEFKNTLTGLNEYTLKIHGKIGRYEERRH